MKKRVITYIFLSPIIIILGIIIYSLFIVENRSSWDTYREYTYLFSESAKKMLGENNESYKCSDKYIYTNFHISHYE